MKKRTCEICGQKSKLGALTEHHVVPTKFTEKAGLPASRIVRLCSNCHLELDKWYAAKVAPMAYDTKTQRFVTKSWLEMSKEYDSAFNSFVRYKQERRTKD